MGPSDSLPIRRRGYVFPLGRWMTCTRPTGPLSSRSCLSARAVPFDPGEPDGCIYPLLHCPCWLRPWRRLDRSHMPNEADLGSLSLRLMPSPSGASRAGLLRPHARSATWQTGHSMMNSFQFTRQNRFHWRTAGAQRSRSGASPRLLRLRIAALGESATALRYGLRHSLRSCESLRFAVSRRGVRLS